MHALGHGVLLHDLVDPTEKIIQLQFIIFTGRVTSGPPQPRNFTIRPRPTYPDQSGGSNLTEDPLVPQECKLECTICGRHDL